MGPADPASITIPSVDHSFEGAAVPDPFRWSLSAAERHGM